MTAMTEDERITKWKELIYNVVMKARLAERERLYRAWQLDGRSVMLDEQGGLPIQQRVGEWLRNGGRSG